MGSDELERAEREILTWIQGKHALGDRVTPYRVIAGVTRDRGLNEQAVRAGLWELVSSRRLHRHVDNTLSVRSTKPILRVVGAR